MGEIGIATVTIINPTAETLEIPDPSNASEFWVCQRGRTIDPALSRCQDPDDRIPESIITLLPTRLIAPSETITVTAQSDLKRSGVVQLTRHGGPGRADTFGVRVRRG
jgi:hypothetical protein